MRHWERYGRMPQALAEEPVLDRQQAYELHTWQLLSAGRGINAVSGATSVQMLPQPIALLDILASAALYGFDPIRWVSLARALDAVYLEHVLAKSRSAAKANGHSKPSN